MDSTLCASEMAYVCETPPLDKTMEELASDWVDCPAGYALYKKECWRMEHDPLSYDDAMVN